MGVDFNSARLGLAEQFGAETVNPGAGEDVIARALTFSRGLGVDAVIITASSESNEPVSQAAQMCRKRGRIVLVGVTGLELSRADFYEKELTFQVSCSYGPGRYDPNYEERGHDYPLGFVRWTEQRNFEAVLGLMATGQLDVAPLVSHRFELDQASEAYAILASNQPSLGILINYGDSARRLRNVDSALTCRTVALAEQAVRGGRGSVAFIGSGNYAGRVLIPAFKAAGAQLHTVVSAGGVSAVHYGKKFGFATASTDSQTHLADPAVDTIVIATRHNSHAAQVIAGLEAGKHVFCEKPLCLSIKELDEIEAAKGRHPDQLLLVGFNRRFAPLTLKLKSLVDTAIGPKVVVMTVNAGDIPADHWTQDKDVGGGRIVGEACHFIDLIRHVVGSPIRRWQVMSIGGGAGTAVTEDKSTITFVFEDGSIGTVHYLANGHKGFPKERLEVFCGGKILQLDNFRKLRGWGWKGFRTASLLRQDKGQNACAKAFVDAIRNGDTSPIPVAEIMEVSRVTIEVAEEISG
jgi:predicted dehydrogenase